MDLRNYIEIEYLHEDTYFLTEDIYFHYLLMMLLRSLLFSEEEE